MTENDPHLLFALLLVLGFLIIWYVDPLLKWIGEKLDEQAAWYVSLEDDRDPVLDPKYIGRAERVFFTVAVAFNLPGYLIAMMLWIAAKLAANWEHRDPRSDETRGNSIRALILSISSLGVALTVGLVLRTLVGP